MASGAYQPLSNATAESQSGDGTIASGNFATSGTPCLLGFSCSGWTQTQGAQIEATLTVDGEEVARLQLPASTTAMHLSLGRTWGYGLLAEGRHEFSVVAGPNTITDQNDRVSLTVWELGEPQPVTVREDITEPCNPGTGAIMGSVFPKTGDGPLLVSTSAAAEAASAGLIGMHALVDNTTAIASEIFANNASQELTFVPIDLLLEPLGEGKHQIDLDAYDNTVTTGKEFFDLTVLEIEEPKLVQVTPLWENSEANTTHGGDIVASGSFQTNGGTLIFRISGSGFGPNGGMIGLDCVLDDRTGIGLAEVFANPANVHMPVVSNDIVVTGVGAGSHKLDVYSTITTYTDQNDRLSVTVIELLPGT